MTKNEDKSLGPNIYIWAILGIKIERKRYIQLMFTLFKDKFDVCFTIFNALLAFSSRRTVSLRGERCFLAFRAVTGRDFNSSEGFLGKFYRFPLS